MKKKNKAYEKIFLTILAIVLLLVTSTVLAQAQIRISDEPAQIPPGETLEEVVEEIPVEKNITPQNTTQPSFIRNCSYVLWVAKEKTKRYKLKTANMLCQMS